MPDHIAIKLLTEKSDLGWFKSIFERRGLAGKQKGITLGADVFRRFYPRLGLRIETYRKAKLRQKQAKALTPPDLPAFERAKAAAKAAGSIPVVATLYGPDAAAPFTRNRVIALQDKNWRLNGAFILDPEGEPDRFDPVLQDEDIAIIGFDGGEQPTAVTVLLLAGASAADGTIYAALRPLLSKGAGSMISMEPARLATLADSLALPDGHPLRLLATDTAIERDIEEAARGNERAADRVRRRRKGRPLTPEELAAGKAAAERNGALGEELVNHWLEARSAGGPAQHRWASVTVANAPFDFEILGPSGDVTEVVDVKTTSSTSGTEFFVSIGELEYAAASKVPYRIWRVSEVGATGAWMRQSADFRPVAAAILKAAEAFPSGARPSVVAVSPVRNSLGWLGRVRLHPKVPVAPLEDGIGEDSDAEADEEDEPLLL